MSLLNPARLRSEVEAREARKIKVFEHILELCHNKIITTNQQSDDCCCIFTCPSVVFGMPLFNLMDCIKFIMIKLVEKGFEVHLAVPNNIFISWKKESNPDYSRQMYQLEAPHSGMSSRGNKLAIMPSGGTYNNKKLDTIKGRDSRDGSDGEYKLFSSKSGGTRKEKEKNYRPIEDYRQNNIGLGIGTSTGGYALDDIDLFHSKLDELLA